MITLQRWQQIAAIYEAAFARPDSERAAFLAEACAGDAMLRQEVESLIAQEQVTGPLDKPVWVAGNLFAQPTVLAVGAFIGPYRIEGVLGAGGMGQVYRARDSKLGRSVALKALPDTFAGDPERRARFQREAQVLAALNHPHIGAIHGFEDSGSVHALVLELVEGPTLAERLAQGPIPLDETVAIALQVVDALDAAHDLGIIHRDLKPANIKVRPDGSVKVLDFGLARLIQTDGGEPERSALHLDAGGDPNRSPTITSPAHLPNGSTRQAITQAGAILGTAAYMSPEQAKGRPADARSDVWSFGCVLYEMLTGRRPFAGDDVVETFAAVLRAEPDWSALPASTPRLIRRLLERCLQKDRKRRLAAIADVRLHFDEANAPEPVPVRPSSRTAWLVAAAAVIVALVALATLAARRSVDVPDPVGGVRFTIAPPANDSFGGPPGGGTGYATQVAISPDGQKIVYVVSTEERFQIWLRPIDALTATPIPGTEGGAFPFWSPDSRSIGFFSGNKLMKVAVAGGPSMVLCDAISGRGGSWNRDNVIIFTPAGGGVQRVSGSGGSPVAVTAPDPAIGETNHRWPYFLPDGRHFLYTATTGACCPPPRPAIVRIASLDTSEPAQTLSQEESSVIYVSGYLLFARQEVLMAQPFDADTRQLRGDAFPVAGNLSWEVGRYASVSGSATGTLVFGQGGAVTNAQLTWFDRTGRPLGVFGEVTPYETVTISPDEQRIAVSLRNGTPRSLNVWLYTIASGSRHQLTSRPGDNGSPVWSPDSRWIAYESQRDGRASLRQISIDGQHDDPLIEGIAPLQPTSWSTDGRFLAVNGRFPVIDAGATSVSGSANADVWALSLAAGRVPVPIARTGAVERSGVFSPDGRSVAFTSDETGQGEIMVFVQPFPGPGLRTPISVGSGSYPVWRPDGKELFYIANGGALDGTLMAVQLGPAGQFEGTAPQPLFRTNAPRFYPGQIYAVTRDGQKFMVNGRPHSVNDAPVTVLVNWPATLKNH